MSTFQALFIIVYGISFLSSTSIICSDNDCLNSVIKCSTDDICNIECNGNGCFNSTIFCASNKECFISCNGRNSCSFSTIHAEQSSSFGLYLVAYNPYTVSYSDYYSQFMELTVYLPITSPTKHNVIQGVYNHRYPVLINPKFYSIDHFKNTDVYNVSFSNGVMFYSSNFSKKCRFDSQYSSQSSLYCIDTLPSTTSMSTTIETMLKESDEMEDETDGDEKKYDSALYYLTKYDILIIICIILVLLLCCVCCLFGFYILGSQHTLSRITHISSDGTRYKLSRTNLSSTNSGSSSTNQSKLAIGDVGKTHEPFNHSSNPSQEIDLPELHAPPPSEYTNPMTFTEYEEYIKTHFMALQRLSLKQPSNKSNISRNSQRTDGTDTSEISSVPVPAQLSNKPPQQQTPAIRLNVHSETLTGGNNSSSSDEENIFIRYADENTRSDGISSHNKKPTHIRGSPNIDNQNSMSDVINKLSTSDPANLNLNPMSKNSNEHSLELECTFRSRDRGHIEGNSMDSGIDHVDNKCDDKPDADVWSNNLSENMDKFEIVTTPWRGEMSQNQDSPSTMNLHPHIYEKSVLMPKLHDMTSGSSVPTLPTLPASVHRARTTTRRDSEEKMDTVAMDDNKDNKDKNKYGNNLSPAALHGNNNLSLDSMLPIVKMHSEISISPRQETNTVYTGYHGHGVELDQEQTPSGITLMGINPPQCTFLNVDNGQDSQSYPTCFLE